MQLTYLSCFWLFLLSLINCRLSFEQAFVANNPENDTNALGLISKWAEIDHMTAQPISTSDLDLETNRIYNCTALINLYGDVVANFTSCAVHHARPITFCEACVEEYTAARDVFGILTMKDSKDEKGVPCHRVIKDFDKVAIIIQAKEFVENMWKTSHCDDCFEVRRYINDSYIMSNDTTIFMELLHATQKCFLDNSNYTKIELANNSTRNANVCSNCKDTYQELNTFFKSIHGNYQPGLCMDIVDAMNETRREWSQNYGCRFQTNEIVSVIVLSLVFALVPVVFYVGNIIFSRRQQQHLLKQKRIHDTHIEPQMAAPSTSTAMS